MTLTIAANWKMHKTAAETVAFCQDIRSEENKFSGVDVLICPPFTALSAAAEALRASSFRLGAQNLHWEEKGAFTGEIAAAMLTEFGVSAVIIGHSERRHLMGEKNEHINLKIRAAIKSGLQPILCVGETEDQKAQGATKEIIEEQLLSALEGLTADQVSGLVVAYEPVWAIGTGKAASPDDAEEAASLILRLVYEHFALGKDTGPIIQYGGSVKADNIGTYMTLTSVSGALVGGASLEAKSFSALIDAARKAVLH
jgi:triosephosphate isomerase (TIM)